MTWWSCEGVRGDRHSGWVGRRGEWKVIGRHAGQLQCLVSYSADRPDQQHLFLHHLLTYSDTTQPQMCRQRVSANTVLGGRWLSLLLSCSQDSLFVSTLAQFLILCVLHAVQATAVAQLGLHQAHAFCFQVIVLCCLYLGRRLLADPINKHWILCLCTFCRTDSCCCGEHEQQGNRAC